MMNGDYVRVCAARTVSTILHLLDEDSIAQLIDTPLDEAVSSFRFEWEQPFSPGQFHRVLGEFVGHIHKRIDRPFHGQAVRWARNEAVALLAHAYEGVAERGYDGALLDIVYAPEFPREGIDTVLLKLADIIKGLLRQQYVDWVYARYLDPFDRELLLAIVGHVVERHRHLLTKALLDPPRFELIGEIRHLLETLGDTQTVAERVQAHRMA